MPDGIPSPNPDYPQQIKNVTGNANVKIQNKNLLDLSKCTVKNGTLNSDNSITSNIIDGYYTQINTTSLNKYLLEHKGQSITFSIDKVLNNKSISIVIYGQRESSTYQDVTVSNSKTVTLTIANDFTLIDTLELRVNRSNTKFTDTTTTVSEIMLEQGSTATSYVPHQEQNYPFSLKSKNLIDISTLEKGYVSATGIITVNDTMGERYSKFIKVKPDTNYIFSIIETSSTYNNWFGVGEYSSNNYSRFIRRDIMTTASQSYIQFTTSSTTEYVVVSARNLKGATKIQLEEGTTATDYEPYYDIKAMQGTTLQDDGIHNAWKKVVFDGSEDEKWAYYSGNTVRTVFKIPVNSMNNYISVSAIPNIKSSHFIATSQNATWEVGDISRSISDKNLYIIMQPDMTVANLRTWLSSNPVTVEYELLEPEIIPYNETQQAQYNAIKQARSYDDQTNISSTSDELGFKMDVESLSNGVSSSNTRTLALGSLNQGSLNNIKEVDTEDTEVAQDAKVETSVESEE